MEAGAGNEAATQIGGAYTAHPAALAEQDNVLPTPLGQRAHDPLARPQRQMVAQRPAARPHRRRRQLARRQTKGAAVGREQQQCVVVAGVGQQGRSVILGRVQIEHAHATTSLPTVEVARRALGYAAAADGDNGVGRGRLVGQGGRGSGTGHFVSAAQADQLGLQRLDVGDHFGRGATQVGAFDHGLSSLSAHRGSSTPMSTGRRSKLAKVRSLNGRSKARRARSISSR